MKKVLLGTSALVAAGLIAGPAMAQLELEVTAEFYWEIGFKDDDVDDDDEFDMQNEGDLQFTFSGTADNGLRYGFQFDLDDIATNEDVEVDETFLFVQGNFGRIEAGDNDGAHGNLRFFIPTVGIGGIDGGAGDYVGFGANTLQSDNATDTSDSTKVLYQTTGIDLGGFLFGVSYAPDVANDDGDFAPDLGNDVDVDRTSASGDAFETGIEVGARWTGSFGDFDVGVGGGYTFADTNVRDAENVNAFTIGAEVGTGGFTFGAQFAYEGESGSGSFVGPFGSDISSAEPDVATDFDDAWRISVGATYETGPWGFGVNGFYAQAEEINAVTDAAGTPSGEVDEWAIAGSVAYALVPGFEVAADLVYFEYDFDAGTGSALTDTDNDGVVGILRTTVEF